METSAMASMMAAPRRGHLDILFQMFSFLKAKHNAVMVFDPTIPEIDISQFPKEDWSATPYGECHEDIPANGPEHTANEFTSNLKMSTLKLVSSSEPNTSASKHQASAFGVTTVNPSRLRKSLTEPPILGRHDLHDKQQSLHALWHRGRC